MKLLPTKAQETRWRGPVARLPGMRVGIIGCGEIAQIHLAHVLRNKGVVVVGVADANEGRARNTARRFGIESFYTSLESLLSETQPDVVHILTPPASHAALAIQAMKSGCHVLIEKPMAISLEQAEQVIAVARQTCRKLCVDHNHLFDPIVLKAKDYLARGALGELLAVDHFQGFGVRHDQLRHGSSPRDQWMTQLPLGAIQDLAPHSLAFLVDFVGTPVSFQVATQNMGISGMAPWDEVKILVKGKKILGSYTISLSTQPYINRLIIYGSEMTLELYLNHMILLRRNKEYPVPRPLRRALPCLEESWQLVSGTARNTLRYLFGRLRPYPGMGELIRRFYESIERDLEPPVSSEQAREVVSLMDRLTESITNGEKCSLSS